MRKTFLIGKRMGATNTEWLSSESALSNVKNLIDVKLPEPKINLTTENWNSLRLAIKRMVAGHISEDWIDGIAQQFLGQLEVDLKALHEGTLFVCDEACENNYCAGLTNNPPDAQRLFWESISASQCDNCIAKAVEQVYG